MYHLIRLTFHVKKLDARLPSWKSQVHSPESPNETQLRPYPDHVLLAQRQTNARC